MICCPIAISEDLDVADDDVVEFLVTVNSEDVNVVGPQNPSVTVRVHSVVGEFCIHCSALVQQFSGWHVQNFQFNVPTENARMHGFLLQFLANQPENCCKWSTLAKYPMRAGCGN